jgi:alpha-L-arabinofuranosidase
VVGLLAAVALVLVVLLVSLGSHPQEQAFPDSAPNEEISGSISVDATKVIKPVSRGLYGIHATWVYDAEGLWDPDKAAFRPQVLKLAEDLQPGPIRFPGGIGADFYHWRDGIGPQGSRPMRSHGSDEGKSSNGFGTGELMAFSKATGGEPLLMVNILNGTPEEAADWVAYCNQPENVERARNGSPKPYGVRLWEVGNEPYAKAWSKAQKQGQLSAEEYSARFLQYAAAMKKVDPSIRLLAVGGHNFGRYSLMDDNSWTKTLLLRAGPAIDYLAVHNAYTPVMAKKSPFYEVYRAMITFPEIVKEDFKNLNRDIEAYAPKDADRIKLAVTEWGPFFAPAKDETYLDHTKTLGAALLVASMMQVFLNADRVEIANFFKFIDYLGFMGMVGRDGVAKASYYALQMYSRHFGDVLVSSTAQSPTYDFGKALAGVDAARNLPYLVAVASLSADRSKMYIVAVNKHFTDSIRTTIRIQGFQPKPAATLWTLTGPSLDANNGPDLPDVGIKWPKPAKEPRGSTFDQGKPDTVTIQRSNISNVSNSFELVIPSKAVISLEMERR